MRLIEKTPSKKFWVQYILRRIENNKNFLGFIAGPTGSGKSWCSLRIAEELDPKFNIDRVVFSGRELMALINSNKLHKGSAIVFEEAGIEMSNRNWQSTTNKMLNFLMQTFRHRNFILIFNSPYMDFVDSATRKLFHAEMTTCGIDKVKSQVKLKPLCIQYNARYSKFYYKRLKVRTPEGAVPVSYWKVDKPSNDLLKAYEDKKRVFTDALNEEIQGELDRLSGIAKKPLTQKQQNILDELKKGGSVTETAKRLSLSPQYCNVHIMAIRKKGFVIEPVKEGAKVISYEIS
jgi:DNA-binding CsgD family transcriptional regulator